jgi:hypothetical protein
LKHVLIAVGCDVYDNSRSLDGAENDARNIFSLLTDIKYGFCEADCSTLILSPSLTELQRGLLDASKSLLPGDVVTFYFAGHGYVKGNIFYMCCRDTQVDRIGVSALPLNNLLSLIHEVTPSHANLIIDACNSGGVMGDFNRVLSPDTIGSAATTGITLLAACAQDQFAAEVNGEGLCTSIIIRCINGTTFVQDLDVALDLASISTIVSRDLRQTNQQPAYWGLNLTGRPNFCTNPHFSGDSDLRRTLAEARPMAMLPGTANTIQNLYSEIDHGWVPKNLQQVLAKVLPSGGDPGSNLSFLNNLANAMRQRAGQSHDPFREIEVVVTCLSPLLVHCKRQPVIESYVIGRCVDLGVRIVEICQDIHEELLRDEFALLGDTGVGELFILPGRITSLLGWLGWAIVVSRTSGGDATTAEGLAGRLLAIILDKYQGSVRAMTDAQAPALLVIAVALKATEARENLEKFAGLYFLDLCEAKGLISRTDMDSSFIIDFLLSKSDRDPNAPETIANPSTFLCVLLLLAKELELEDAFDLGMSDLDHRNANAFIPSSYSDFAFVKIDDGYNATFQIGHGIWRVADFSEKWNGLVRPVTESAGISLLSTACSLIYPDRIAWHLLD